MKNIKEKITFYKESFVAIATNFDKNNGIVIVNCFIQSDEMSVVEDLIYELKKA